MGAKRLRGLNDVRVGLPRGVKWCKSGAAIGGFFRKTQLKTLTYFWAALGFQGG